MFGTFFDTITKGVILSSNVSATFTEVMMDFDKAYSIKEGTRQIRGAKGPRLYITSSS